MPCFVSFDQPANAVQLIRSYIDIRDSRMFEIRLVVLVLVQRCVRVCIQTFFEQMNKGIDIGHLEKNLQFIHCL